MPVRLLSLPVFWSVHLRSQGLLLNVRLLSRPFPLQGIFDLGALATSTMVYMETTCINKSFWDSDSVAGKKANFTQEKINRTTFKSLNITRPSVLLIKSLYKTLVNYTFIIFRRMEISIKYLHLSIQWFVQSTRRRTPNAQTSQVSKSVRPRPHFSTTGQVQPRAVGLTRHDGMREG